jgi:hypothetical protein
MTRLSASYRSGPSWDWDQGEEPGQSCNAAGPAGRMVMEPWTPGQLSGYLMVGPSNSRYARWASLWHRQKSHAVRPGLAPRMLRLHDGQVVTLLWNFGGATPRGNNCKLLETSGDVAGWAPNPERVELSFSRSRERRHLAAHCVAAAIRSVDPEVRLRLIELAQRWLELAALSEGDERTQALRGLTVQAAIATDSDSAVSCRKKSRTGCGRFLSGSEATAMPQAALTGSHREVEADRTAGLSLGS